MKHVFKPGDKVRIINPIFIQRVGYPKCLRDYITVELKERAVNIVMPKDEHSLSIFRKDLPYYAKKAIRAVANSLAYVELHRDRFGGNIRQLHTITKPEWANRLAEIVSLRTAKTGVYERALGSGEDYEPALLCNQKTHRIASLSVAFCVTDEFRIISLKEAQSFVMDVEVGNLEPALDK